MGLIIGLCAPKVDTILTDNLNRNTIKVRISKTTVLHHMHANGYNECMHMVRSDGFRFGGGFGVYVS